jgi:hypothetical protein
MGYLIDCHLCGRKIDSHLLGDEDQDWRAIYQELKWGEDANLPKPGISDITSEPEHYVHAACWKVAQARVEVRTFKGDQIYRFRTLLNDIPELLTVPFLVSPSLSDDVLQAEPEDPEKGCTSRTKEPYLPPEIWDTTFSLLETVQDVDALRTAIKVEPSKTVWEALQMQVFGVIDHHTPENVTNILRNLSRQPTSVFKHTTNYTTVLQNTDIVLSKMAQHFRGEQAGMTDSKYHFLTAGSPSAKCSPVFETFPETSNLRFHFSRSLTESYLTGVTDGTTSVGYEGDQVIEIAVSSINGIRVIYDEHRIAAIQFKINNDWDRLLAGDCVMRKHSNSVTFCSETHGLSNCVIVGFFDV